MGGYFAVTEEPASWTAAYGSLNVRMINVSLPGLGLSFLHPGRKVADWPRTDGGRCGGRPYSPPIRAST